MVKHYFYLMFTYKNGKMMQDDRITPQKIVV